MDGASRQISIGKEESMARTVAVKRSMRSASSSSIRSTIRSRSGRIAAGSVPEQEFLRVHQHPPQILDRLATILCRGQVLGRRGEFGGARVAGEGDEIELADDRLGRL